MAKSSLSTASLPSSTSASTETSFAAFLRESFDVLRAEMPDLHALMCQRLAPSRVELRVGDELVGLAFSENDVVFRLGAPRANARSADIEVRTTRQTILELVDAETTMLDSVTAETLFFGGALGELARFYDGLMIYLHGAMRAPSFPNILRRFRHGQ